MANELVKIETNNTLATQQQNDAWGDEDDEVKVTYISIKQPSSTTLDEFTTGDFVQKKSQRSWKTMEIVPLYITKTRRWGTPYQIGVLPVTLCRSNTRGTKNEVPVTDDDRFTPAAVNCASCPNGQKAWSNWDKVAKTGKPLNPCEREVDMLFIEKDSGNPYIFSAHGGAVAPMEGIRETLLAMSTAVQEAYEKENNLPRKTGPRPQPYEYTLKMTTERAGKNFAPKFTGIVKMNKANVATFGPLFELFVTSRANRVFAQGQDKAVDAALESAEVESEPVVAAQVQPEYLPPTSKRKAGAGKRPTYVPPTETEEVQAI